MTVDAMSNPTPAWGHSSGLLRIPPEAPLESTDLSDRIAIIDRMYRYAWSFDERQRQMLSDCFTSDATWEAHMMGTSIVGPHVGGDDVVKFMTSFWDNQLDQRRHMIMNPIIEAQTESEATILTYHLLVSTTVESGVVPVTTGFYRVNMVKTTAGEWKIRKLVAGYDVPF
jgi:hypothetical protein